MMQKGMIIKSLLMKKNMEKYSIQALLRLILLMDIETIQL